MSNADAESEGYRGQRVAPPVVFEPHATTGLLRDLAKLSVPPEAIRILPADFVKRHQVLPLAVHNGTIEIATATPGDQRVIEDIRLLSGLEVEEHRAPLAEIQEKITECYQVTVEKMIEDLHPQHEVSAEGRTLHDIEVMANEPSDQPGQRHNFHGPARTGERYPYCSFRGECSVALPD
jgi:hypothetical protein